MRNPMPSLRLVTMSGLIAGVLSSADAASVRMPSRYVPEHGAIAAAAKDQVAPFLCQGGTTVLAVWSDNRANSTGGYEGETSWDVYGMRFDAGGNPLDAVPFAIAAGPASHRNPRTSWNGTNWLVVFESVDFGGTALKKGGPDPHHTVPAIAFGHAAQFKVP